MSSESIPLAPDEVPNQVPSDVLVSVIITAFQHSDYIAQALESVLSQKTAFSYEICLGEDDSTDGTRGICQSYAEKYPDKIRLFLRSDADKIWAEGRKTGKHNIIQTFRAVRGKYIALLDGDDFWIHPDKLQMQVDYLERTTGCDICATCSLKWGYQTSDVAPTSLRSGIITPTPYRHHIALTEVLAGGTHVNTCTFLFRRTAYTEPPEWASSLILGDWVILVSILQKGTTCAVLPTVTAVYRVHSKGVFRSHGMNRDWYLDLHTKHLKAFLNVAPPYCSSYVTCEICDIELRRFTHRPSLTTLKIWVRHPLSVVGRSVIRAIVRVGSRGMGKCLFCIVRRQSPSVIEGFTNSLLNPHLDTLNSVDAKSPSIR